MNSETVIAEERRIMDLYAPLYRTNTLTNSYPYQVERRAFADWIATTASSAGIDPRSARVLDVGCGTGEILELLQHRGYRQLIGIDAASGMIAEAQRHLPAARFIHSEIDQWRGADQPFQLITAAFTVHHLFRPRSFFELVDRVLAPGGWFFLLEYNGDSWTRRPSYRRVLYAPLIAARALLKFKNRRQLAALDQVPALFNSAHRELTFGEILDALPDRSAYDVRRITRGLWEGALRHSLSGESAFDRALLRAIGQIERWVLPANVGHFQWIAGHRRDTATQ